LLLWEEVAIEGTPSQLVAAPYVPRHKRDSAPSTYDYLQNLERERESNETTRVLYVAATRTRRRLHLVGAVRPDCKGEIKAPANSLLSLLWESVGGEFLDAEPRPEIVATETSSAFIPSLVRLPHVAFPELLQSGTLAAVRPAFDEATTDTNIRSIDASCGTLVHLYLEMMADDGLQHWSSHRLHRLQSAMQTWLQGQGHARDEAKQGAEKVLHALCRTLDSEAGQWVLASRGSAASELALATADGSQFATHVIDRTFVEDGVRWVIDYKSARLDAVEEDALTREAARYRPQLERYAALFLEDGLPIRKAVFFVAHGKLVELD
jgi:ATP-dependent helicase/nuclease subunit A